MKKRTQSGCDAEVGRHDEGDAYEEEEEEKDGAKAWLNIQRHGVANVQESGIGWISVAKQM